jgi:hypothetical protein
MRAGAKKRADFIEVPSLLSAVTILEGVDVSMLLSSPYSIVERASEKRLITAASSAGSASDIVLTYIRRILGVSQRQDASEFYSGEIA